MNSHLAQLRVSLAAICALLLTLLLPVTTFAYGGSISLGPTQGPPATEMAVTGSGFGPSYDVPIDFSESTSSVVTAHVNDNGVFPARLTIPASVVLTPAKGPPGTVTIADGSGFTPNQPVAVTQSGGPEITGGGATVRADQSGTVSMSFRIADQTRPGVITVTFTQEDNTATAQFRVTPSPSGTGGALTQPIKGTIDEFSQWLNACVNGRFNIPVCTG